MDLVSIALVSGALLAFALVSGRLQGTIFMPPLVFIVFGYLIGQGVLGIANVDPGHGAIHVIAALTLILVLFSDA
ncbi:MAG: sodium:proton antiporter, partial [Gammaproteobacteria bacterium]|nr:sodium:proton antiporter [Gammaproteobacteria bacterium]